MNVTLNFLSPEKKSDIRTGFILAYAQTALLFIFVVVTFASGILLALRLFVSSTYADLEQRVQTTSDDSKTLSGAVAQVNAYLGRVDRYQSRFVAWSPIIVSLSQMVPPGAQTSSIVVSPDGQITMTGVARERADVLTLQDNLKKSPLLTNVAAPLSNILQQQNVTYTFTMNYVGMPKIPAEGAVAPRGQTQTAP